MNKLSIAILLAVAVCSTYGVSDRRSVRSAISEVVEVSSEASLVANAITEPKEHKDSVVAESVLTDLFTGRGKKGSGHKNNKMEMMHMGLSYVKMVIATFMSIIGHLFAFKSVGLTLISVLIQIAQFIMVLKKNKESQPSYKIVETPWHTAPQAPSESYGSYSSHSKTGVIAGNSPYAVPTVQRRR